MKNRYKITVTFRDGSTREREFDDFDMADSYQRRYLNMDPDPDKPKTQVTSVHWSGWDFNRRPWGAR